MKRDQNLNKCFPNDMLVRFQEHLLLGVSCALHIANSFILQDGLKDALFRVPTGYRRTPSNKGLCHNENGPSVEDLGSYGEGGASGPKQRKSNRHSIRADSTVKLFP